MTTNSLSVIVPAYNEADTIEACLESLWAQIDDIHEIVVVDNNSTDDTAERVLAFGNTRSAPVRLLSEPRQGLPYARNTGLDAAEGSILARIDADTRVDPGWARALVDFFDRHGGVYEAGTGTCTSYDLPFQESFRTQHRALADSVDAQLDSGDDVDIPRLFGSNMAMTAAAWNRISARTSMRTDIFEDVDVTLCLTRVGVRCALIPRATARISGRRFLTGPVSYVRYCLCDQRTFAVHGLSAERRRAVRNMFRIALPFYAAMWIPFRAWDAATEEFRPMTMLRPARTTSPPSARQLVD